jgi:hypothetical protein
VLEVAVDTLGVAARKVQPQGDDQPIDTQALPKRGRLSFANIRPAEDR